MSTVAALFSVFARRQWNKVQFSPTPYFETNLLAQRFFNTITFDQADDRFASNREVLWLDTSSLTWPIFPKTGSSVRMIVVDTTCVEPSNIKISQWLHESARLKCLLALIRSHIKLDSFGLELGRLGSIVLIAPDDNPGETEKYIKELLQARSGFGTGFSLINLYPWLGNPDFAHLTRLRTNGIYATTQHLYSALIDSRKPTDQFEILPSKTHGLFLIIQTHTILFGRIRTAFLNSVTNCWFR